MSNLDKKQLLALVSASAILTSEERSYWQTNLPNMNDKQCQRLEQILQEAASPLPFEAELQQFLETAIQAAMQVLPQGLTVSA
jgi:hypothetical protein